MLRLTQVEMLGFKSFPHKTVFELDRGVTCVVGPNGSGKSNLADAINFAFGSQSGRELRASRLSSLIFAGTEQIRPLNIANVTLHFEYTGVDTSRAGAAAGPDDATLLGDLSLLEGDDEGARGAGGPAREGGHSGPPHPDGASGPDYVTGFGYGGRALTRHIPPGGAVQPGERTPAILKLLQDLEPGARVSLTRRVFRDGTAGYYINNEAVRLKDVDELFNRFNLGRSAVYSINQGEVEQKILASPQEMREWLAEATGVALLLQHKLRAQQKLKRTQANLERLEDIRGSTRQLVADLAEQRAAAEEHLRLKAQLRAVELNEIRREVEFAQRQQQSAAAALTEAAQRLEQATAQLEAERAAAQRLQRERDELERALEQAEAQQSTGQQRLATLRQQSALAAQAVETHALAVERSASDVRELEQQATSLAAEVEQATARHQAARTELEGVQGAGQELRGAREQAQQAVQALSAQQQTQRGTLLELAAQTARLHNMLEHNDRSSRQLAGQLELREQQAALAAQRLAELIAEAAAEQQRSEELALTLGQQRDALDEHALELVRLKEQLATADERAAALRHQQSDLSSRRRTIAELAEKAGQAAGPAALLADTQLSAGLERVTDSTFPPEYRAAFTRLLAHAGDALAGPTGQRTAALQLLADKSADALWLDSGAVPELHPDSLWRRLAASPAVLGGLYRLYGEVLLADDLAQADSLLAAEPVLRWVVLRDGSALVGRGHAYLGQPAPERALRVAQRSDLAYLDAQLETTRGELDEAAARVTELRQTQSERQKLRDEAAASVAAADAQLKSQLALGDRLLKTLDERRAELQLQQQQTTQLAQEQQRLTEERPGLEEKYAAARQKQQTAEQDGERLTAARLEAETALEDARRAEAEANTRRELAEQQVKHLETQLFDLAERRHNIRARLDGLHKRIAEHSTEQDQSRAVAVQAAEEAQVLEADLASAATLLAGQREQRQALAEAGQAALEALERAAQAASRCEQDSASAESQRERAVERVADWLDILKEKYNLTLSELLADAAVTGTEWSEVRSPKSGVRREGDAEAATPDYGQRTPDGSADFVEAGIKPLDPTEAGRLRLRDARQRITAALDELGPVNLLAIEQHATHSQRLQFLDSQAVELERAVDGLQRLVTDLDSGTETRYRAALGQIEERFSEIFTGLFGGGTARLRFETPESLVDSGVEIEVQLPGSRKMALRSLSGGQRSLIFLSLFFAVHSVRSPGFCILDEADAALDEANVKRYSQLIQRFSEQEQFIVVTHNKQTMEVADRLIGVVGRPKGVSNLLAVDLKKAQKLADQKGVGVA
jgi:chromosome segregation protein